MSRHGLERRPVTDLSKVVPHIGNINVHFAHARSSNAESIKRKVTARSCEERIMA